ncbi:DUF1259 domain-containing protein [Bradyrhizobium diazoefficiens]|uniref:DUF1259 domain-containing protein n=1 Tax=Bradyrhizobium TaxID=374 RepID=UPI000AA2762B|nr:DUF1259 domain-containing protein [Bradyrhizobium diazoefficiens]
MLYWDDRLRRERPAGGPPPYTAVHNHPLRASPATFYMHVAGHGDPVKRYVPTASM